MATEKRLIDAKALERQIKEAFKDSNPVLMGQMLRWVRKQTKVDAVEVVHGSWWDTDYMIPTVVCSVCGGMVRAEYTTEHGNNRKYNFCPFCGAKMDRDGNG